MQMTEIPSPHRKWDTHMLPGAKQDSWSQPVFVPTLKDRLVVAIVSLVVLVFCAVFMFGTAKVLHAGIIGWTATLVVILLAVIALNVVLALSSSPLKR